MRAANRFKTQQGMTAPKRAAGFTLIEMMAVVVIIGLAAGIAAVSLGTGTRGPEVRNFSRQLYNTINLAFEESVYTNRQFGLRFDITQEEDDTYYVYQWLMYDPDRQRWFLSEIEELKEQKFPRDMELRLEVEGQQVVVGANDKEDIIFYVASKPGQDGVEIHPDIYFFSSGETQNFRISLADEASPDNRYRIIGNLIGQVRMLRPDQTEDEDE
ncbi:Type II secretion system protein H [BD1-7 clade bacterium]|uniref:Type II secretion system protein H n=1 Tax=BD1-7 clade bacterium TaxID=2029982 RepID=A0A5S9R1A2_9GAMM|nr:Type II secretion system protein H [BD1-7 clade bacterium]